MAAKNTRRRSKKTTRPTKRRSTRATARRKGTRARRVVGRGRRGKGTTRFERTWKEALRALSGAEAQVEKEIRAFVKRTGLDTRQAAAIWKQWNARLGRERRRATKQLEAGLSDLQARARKERRALVRIVDDAVEGALAAVNIPSRQEVQELTRKVNQLSRKIDAFRR